VPPAELAAHPSGGRTGHELYFMCGEPEATVSELRPRASPSLTAFPEEWWNADPFPVAGRWRGGMYERRHPLAIDL
jgi:hypothetical protein